MMTDELRDIRDHIDRACRVGRMLSATLSVRLPGGQYTEEFTGRRLAEIEEEVSEVRKLRAREREMMAAQQPATPATSEAQEVLEKVRGIVVAWEISKHRSAGADSSGSMAQIQAALMP